MIVLVGPGSLSRGTETRPGTARSDAAGAGGRRHHRRRHHRHLRRAASGPARRVGGLVREGRHRRRAVEPQLGLGAASRAATRASCRWHRSLRQWQGMNEVGRGRDRLSHAPASCTGIETDAEMARHEAWLRHAQLYQLDSPDHRPGRVRPADAGRRGKFRGALYTARTAGPNRRRPRPPSPSPRAGWAPRCSPTARSGRSSARAARVAAVVTEKGRIRTSSVVLAGGAWSSLFVGNLGIRLPQLTVINSVMRTAPLEGGPELGAVDDRLSRSASGSTAATPSPTVRPTCTSCRPTASASSRTSCRRCRSNGARTSSGSAAASCRSAGFKKRWTGEDRTVFEDIRINRSGARAALDHQSAQGPAAATSRFSPRRRWCRNGPGGST